MITSPFAIISTTITVCNTKNNNFAASFHNNILRFYNRGRKPCRIVIGRQLSALIAAGLCLPVRRRHDPTSSLQIAYSSADLTDSQY